MNRLVKVFERNESYNVRFLPNINNIPESIIELKYATEKNPKLSTIFFSYILRDDEATPVKFGRYINDMLRHCIHGYTGTPEGHYITDGRSEIVYYPNMYDKYGKLKCYYANETKSRIVLDKEIAKQEKLTEYTDMIEYEPRNPFDIKTGISLKFETKGVDCGDVKNVLSFDNLRWVNSDPLWEEGMPKETITDLYKDVPSLNRVIEAEIDYLERELNSGKLLTGETAKKHYWNYRNLQKTW